MFGLTAVQFAFAVETMIWFLVAALIGVVAALTFAHFLYWRRIPETDWAADIDYRREDQRAREAGE